MVSISSTKSDRTSRGRKIAAICVLLVLFPLVVNLLFDERSSFSEQLERQYNLYSSERPARLPPSYRYAESSVCRYGQWQRSQNITLSQERLWQPKVTIENQNAFSAGKYEQIAKGSGEIHKAGAFLTTLSKLQHSSNIFGTVGELGVHHGRFTGFLFQTARLAEELVAADLFLEHQDKNVDNSGMGDLKMFVKSMKVYGLDAKKNLHTLHSGSSDEIPFDWSHQAKFDPFRLISVDAGHTAALTYNDLELAFCNLQSGGIVVLDDWFHPMWPGVVEGYHQFVAMGPNVPELTGQVYPFLLCECKLYVTNDKDFHAKYYGALLHDRDFEQWVTPYAHEKERGKMLYEMNGVNYLRCRSSANKIPVEDIRSVWTSRVY